MSNVVTLPVITTIEQTPAQCLAKAMECDLTEVVVIGLLPSGEFYFSGSRTDGSAVLWSLEIAKKRLLAMMDPVDV